MRANEWLIDKLAKQFDKLSFEGEVINELLMELVNTKMKLDDDVVVEKNQRLSKNITFLHIYFKHPGIIQYTRGETYGIWDLIGKSIL